jgi:ComF family protein
VESRTSFVIVPVPLSRKNKRKRGFNQAELIARNLSDKWTTSDVGQKNIRCLTNVLYKNRATISQVNMKDREKRLKNLKGTFSVKNKHLIKNSVVLVVDDVSTTGATINEARRALKLAGAKEVFGVVVAK